MALDVTGKCSRSTSATTVFSTSQVAEVAEPLVSKRVHRHRVRSPCGSANDMTSTLELGTFTMMSDHMLTRSALDVAGRGAVQPVTFRGL